ncbi:MAG: hypothetical protein NC084_04930 [Bacteroides sp.]|nr:hypothetical protein [Eubacterium sp.]MCM1418444.1 hypothetical protein [Roseburia sp.]MCM1462040.1 hypothetical protein [Bacteroides sp.]
MMKNIREEIDRELSAYTFDEIDRGRVGEPPQKRKERTMKIGKKAITGLVAAAVAAGVTITAGAVSEWDYGRLVSGLFGHQEEPAQDRLDPMLANAEVIENTFTNYDVRLDGAVYDGMVLMLSVNISDKNGEPFAEGHDYSSTFMAEEISQSGHQWWRVNDDGTLQAYCVYDHVEKDSSPEEVTVTYYYVLRDSGMLKLQPVEELSPEEVLDPGSITFKVALDVSPESKDVELKNADGVTVSAHITPISIELVYDKEWLGDREIVSLDVPKFVEIYGKDGEPLIGYGDYNGGVGDETGRGYKGVPYYLATFSRIIDVNEIAGIQSEDGSFTYGAIPEEDAKEDAGEKKEK